MIEATAIKYFFSDFVAKASQRDFYIVRRFFEANDTVQLDIFNFGDAFELSINYAGSGTQKAKVIEKNKGISISFKTGVREAKHLTKSLIPEYIDFEKSLLELSGAEIKPAVNYKYFDVFGKIDDFAVEQNIEQLKEQLAEKAEFFSKKFNEDLRNERISVLRNKLIARKSFEMSMFNKQFNDNKNHDELSDEDFDEKLNQAYKRAKVECMKDYPLIVILNDEGQAVHVDFESEIRKSLKEEGIELFRDYEQSPAHGKVYIHTRKDIFLKVREKYLKYSEFIKVSEELTEPIERIKKPDNYLTFSIE